MSPKIAVLLSNLESGGVQRSTLNLLRGLSERGLTIDLVVFRDQGSLRKEVPAQTNVVDLHSRTSSGVFTLARYLRSGRPLALLSNQAHVNVSALIAIRLSRSKTRALVVEHNSLSAVAEHAEKWVERQRPLWMRLFYLLADEIIAVSHDLAREMADLAGIPNTKIRVIYNPIVSANLQQKAAQYNDHPWMKDPSVPLVLAVGRLTPQKDFTTLLRAFALLRQNQMARLLILGEGPQRQSLERMVIELGITDTVELSGYIENPYPYIANAEVFVLSSAWEGLPSVLIEALALGTQVVSTNCPTGPEEILNHGRYGQLTPVGDSSALSEAISMAIEKPLPTGRLVERAQVFSVEKAVDAYYHLLLEPK